jgi:hypothetical protein
VGHGTQTHGGAQGGSELMRVVLAGRVLGGARGDVAVIGRPPVAVGQAVAIRGSCPERAGSVALGYLECGGSVAPQLGDGEPFGCCETVQILGKVVALQHEVELLYDAVADALDPD